MLNRPIQLLTRLATGKNILICLGLFIAFNAVIFPLAGARIQALSGGVGPLDLQFSYTPETAYEMLAAYGEGRTFYVLIEMTADVVYPVAYSLLFGLLITYLFQRGFPGNAALQRLALLPFGAMLADYLENAGIVTLLLSYPSQLTALAQATSFFTTAKWTLVGATLALAVVGLAGWAVRKVTSKP